VFFVSARLPVVSILPKDQKFFDLFEKMTATIVEAANYLETIIEDLEDLEVRLVRLKELEHEGDVITHDAVNRLNKTFLTPLDREDLYALTSQLDEVLDWIEEAGQDLGVYKISVPRADARRMAGVIVRASVELDAAVQKLRNHKKNNEAIRRHLVEINRLENQGDTIYRQAVSAIFEEDGLSPIQVMKWKEIYDGLENAIDACEKTAHVIDSILLKHA
jgi:predicted phosphate transport protein (TIGR00153 family)